VKGECFYRKAERGVERNEGGKIELKGNIIKRRRDKGGGKKKIGKTAAGVRLQ